MPLSVRPCFDRMASEPVNKDDTVNMSIEVVYGARLESADRTQ